MENLRKKLREYSLLGVWAAAAVSIFAVPCYFLREAYNESMKGSLRLKVYEKQEMMANIGAQYIPEIKNLTRKIHELRTKIEYLNEQDNFTSFSSDNKL